MSGLGYKSGVAALLRGLAVHAAVAEKHAAMEMPMVGVDEAEGLAAWVGGIDGITVDGSEIVIIDHKSAEVQLNRMWSEMNQREIVAEERRYFVDDVRRRNKSDRKRNKRDRWR